VRAFIPAIFSRRANARLHLRRFTVAAALLLAAAIFVLPARAQKSEKPLSKNDVIELLEGDVPLARVAEVARSHGITFPMTRAAEKDLRDAGADDELVKVLRELAPKAPAEPPDSPTTNSGSGAPSLLIEASPGGAQVYIDDELKASTSPEGRVKFSQLAAGEHTVRLSLAGYHDFEKKVTLKPGESFTFYATLESAKPVNVGSGGSASSENTTTTAQDQNGSSSQKAWIGLLLTTYVGSNGEKGAYIAGVTSNGPADRAGLRVGYVITSTDGHQVTAPAVFLQNLETHRPGDTIEVSYTPSPSTGNPILSTRVQLTAPGSASAGSANVASFLVAHDHGLPAGQNACVGWMTVANGVIHFQGQRAITQGVMGGPTHSFDFPLDEIREARKNGVYLAALGAFHIKLKKGTNINFFVINAQGKYQPPDALLSAIDEALEKASKPLSR
jgi:hypothetical protein